MKKRRVQLLALLVAASVALTPTVSAFANGGEPAVISEMEEASEDGEDAAGSDAAQGEEAGGTAAPETPGEGSAEAGNDSGSESAQENAGGGEDAGENGASGEGKTAENPEEQDPAGGAAGEEAGSGNAGKEENKDGGQAGTEKEETGTDGQAADNADAGKETGASEDSKADPAKGGEAGSGSAADKTEGQSEKDSAQPGKTGNGASAAVSDAEAAKLAESSIFALNELLAAELQAESAIDEVKALIAKLPPIDEVKESDRALIERAEAAYNALSAADQATLDSEVGSYTYATAQTYGRVLECAVWGLKAIQKIDNSTTLADGTYDETTNPALYSEYSKGKSTSPRQKPWSLKNVTVRDGKAYATVTVESTTYTYVHTNGQIYEKTNTSGNCEFANVPVDLNGTMYFGAYSTSMVAEIAFTITNTIDEGEEEGPKEIPLERIELAYDKLDLTEGQTSAAPKVSFFPKNTTDARTVKWSSSDPEIVKVAASTGKIRAKAPGTAVITADCGGKTASYTVTVSAKDGRAAMDITENRTGMFKVIDAYVITKKGKSTLYLTLSADGYRDLFIGTYEDAVKANEKTPGWIKGVRRTDNRILTFPDFGGEMTSVNSNGKWQFAIPVKQGQKVLQIQALSYTHLAANGTYRWYPRKVTIDWSKNAVTADDWSGYEPLTLKNSVSGLTIAKARKKTVGGVLSNNYEVKLILNMADRTFTKMYIGTAARAAKAKKGIYKLSATNKFSVPIRFNYRNSDGTGHSDAREDAVSLYQNLIPGKEYVFSFYSEKDGKWHACKASLSKDEKKLTLTSSTKEEMDETDEQSRKETEEENGGVDPDKMNSNSTEKTSAVDNGTTLADGVYNPGQFRFSYSGGSGRVAITCSKIEVKNGKAYATITFAPSNGRSTSKYDQLRANGQVYTGWNTFTIPISLNKNNTVVGRTTAMSQPHWVAYTIFAGITEPGKEGAGGLADSAGTMDEEAPEILGLKVAGEMEVVYSDLVRIFAYEDGFYLIEVDAARNTWRETEEYQTWKTEYEAAEAEKEAEESAQIVDEGEEYSAEDSTSGQIAGLYRSEVLKYLVAPADAEIPAGLEREVLVIRQPADQVYASAPGALQFLKEMNLLDRVTLLGIEEKDLPKGLYDSKEELPEFGGSYEDWELRGMILKKTNLALEDPAILPEKADSIEEDLEAMVRLGMRAAQMDFSMFVDRSSDEENDLARAEWYKVFGIIFGKNEDGMERYQKAVAAASEQEKKDALAALEKK